MKWSDLLKTDACPFAIIESLVTILWSFSNLMFMIRWMRLFRTYIARHLSHLSIKKVSLLSEEYTRWLTASRKLLVQLDCSDKSRSLAQLFLLQWSSVYFVLFLVIYVNMAKFESSLIGGEMCDGFRWCQIIVRLHTTIQCIVCGVNFFLLRSSLVSILWLRFSVDEIQAYKLCILDVECF